MSFTSKFFQPVSSGSESEDELEDRHIIKQKVPKIIDDFSDEEDKVKRFVKSGQEKKAKEFSDIIKKIKNSLKIKDCDSVLNEFDHLHKILAKYNDPQPSGSVIKILAEIEEFVKKLWEDKEQKSKLSKARLKVLTTLRQRVKKQHKDLESLIQECKDNPDNFNSESGSESDESTDKYLDSNDEDDQPTKNKDSKPTGASSFMKTEKIKETPIKRERKVKSGKKKSDDEEAIALTKKPTKQIKELFMANEIINVESVINKIRELTKLRGRRISDRIILASFYELKKIIETQNLGNQLLVKIYIIIISLQVDTFITDSTMKADQWRNFLTNYRNLLTLLIESDSVVLKEDISEEQESLVESPYVIMGNCVQFIFKINEELNKLMQVTDCYSIEYLNKMKDVTFFSELVSILQSYVEKHGNERQICEVYLLRVEQIYYKLDKTWFLSLRGQLIDSIPIDTDSIEQNSLTDENLINSLCKYLYEHGKDRIPTRAALCQVYHHAIHNRWHQAKQLFLMSRVQESIQNFDVQTHILYNRALVQLGLCAFRQGFYLDALHALKDFHLTGRSKELLAQGLILRNVEKSAKQEAFERRQLLPFHMQINLELVESVYLVSVLVLEGAYSVAPTQEERNNFNSRGLIYLIRNIEKMAIQGPPESMRECIYYAYKSLRSGDWKSCVSHIKNIKCWKLLINSDAVLATLEKELKEQCLIAYVFVNSHAYNKIKLSYLVETFQLPESNVKSSINRMIINDRFPAKWNQDTSILNIYQDSLPNDTHILSSAFIERLGNLSEHHRRIMDILTNVKSAKNKCASNLIVLMFSQIENKMNKE